MGRNEEKRKVFLKNDTPAGHRRPAPQKGVSMIRSFRPDDLPSLMDLWLSGNLEAHAFIPPDHWHRHTALVARLLPQAELSIYETGGHIAGFAGMTGQHLPLHRDRPRPAHSFESQAPADHLTGLSEQPAGAGLLPTGGLLSPRPGHRARDRPGLSDPGLAQTIERTFCDAIQNSCR